MITQFAFRLICGMSCVWLLLPRSQVSSGYFRIQMLVVLGLAVLAALTAGQPLTGSPMVAQPSISALKDPLDSDAPDHIVMHAKTNDAMLSFQNAKILAGVLAGIAFLGSVLWTLERRWGGTFCAVLIALGSTAGMLGVLVTPQSLGTGIGNTTIASELATAAVLGTAMAGMLLGHWYLTATTMSLDPLKRAGWLFLGAAVLRLLVSAYSLPVALQLVQSSTPMMWLWLRWIAGVIGPLVLAVMTIRILRYRNTQSATGVLFVGVILTFIGELSATLLAREIGLPF